VAWKVLSVAILIPMFRRHTLTDSEGNKFLVYEFEIETSLLAEVDMVWSEGHSPLVNQAESSLLDSR
jgi:hypothetical protein